MNSNLLNADILLLNSRSANIIWLLQSKIKQMERKITWVFNTRLGCSETNSRSWSDAINEGRLSKLVVGSLSSLSSTRPLTQLCRGATESSRAILTWLSYKVEKGLRAVLPVPQWCPQCCGKSADQDIWIRSVVTWLLLHHNEKKSWRPRWYKELSLIISIRQLEEDGVAGVNSAPGDLSRLPPPIRRSWYQLLYFNLYLCVCAFVICVRRLWRVHQRPCLSCWLW